jgi:hypothetical protein
VGPSVRRCVLVHFVISEITFFIVTASVTRRGRLGRGLARACLGGVQLSEMPVSATVLGATLGVGVQLYSNAVRKLPLLRSACNGVRARRRGGRERVQRGSDHQPLCSRPVLLLFLQSMLGTGVPLAPRHAGRRCCVEGRMQPVARPVSSSPSLADPWGHAVGAGLGGLFGSAVVAWEVRCQPPQVATFSSGRTLLSRLRCWPALLSSETCEHGTLSSHTRTCYRGGLQRSARSWTHSASSLCGRLPRICKTAHIIPADGVCRCCYRILIV